MARPTLVAFFRHASFGSVIAKSSAKGSCGLEGFAGAGLFGSKARGDAVPASDLDVLVVLKGDVDPGKEIARTGKLVTALSLQFDTVISCVFISSMRYASEENPFLLNVRHEGISI